MQLQSSAAVAAVLIVSCAALTSPASSNNSDAPPTVGSLGPLQVLKYNDLGPENDGTAAVLLYDKLNHSKAKAQCAAIGESLYPLRDAPPANRTELDYQFDYLVYNQTLAAKDSLWISQGGASKDCWAYEYGRKELVKKSCDSKFPVLCTSSVPPTTDVNSDAVDSSRISITYDNYTVTGYRDARSFRFLGLPFADPPLGELRFAPPKPYTGRKALDATKMANACIQVESDVGTVGSAGISEDCLYLNVYTPVLPSTGSSSSSNNATRKPVAVFFYGGSFTQGSASLIQYDGGNFASRNDVVVVTVNYRLGVLGWLATGNLTTGNYGTRDQILGLQWVNKYIASFGGDPSRVTIFGQSAGAQSVMALQSSSAAKGLFSAAIVESAATDLPWYTREVYTKFVVPDVAKAVGCNNSIESSEEALLSCLRSVPGTEFIGNSTQLKNAVDSITEKTSSEYLHASHIIGKVEPFLPIVDDSGSGVIDDQYYRMLANQSLPNRVPTMFTTVTDEASFAAEQIPSLGSSELVLDIVLSKVFPPDLALQLAASGAYWVNYSDPDGVRNTALDAVTHSLWSCAQAYLLRNGAQKVFPSLYEVEIGQGHMPTANAPHICTPNNNYNATCHTADLNLIWGNLNAQTKDVHPYYSRQEVLHSQVLDDVFASFFRSHNPNPDPDYLKVRGPAYAATYEIFGQNKYQIPAYSPDAQDVSLLSMPPGWIEDPGKTRKCAVFDKYGHSFQRARITGG